MPGEFTPEFVQLQEAITLGQWRKLSAANGDRPLTWSVADSRGHKLITDQVKEASK